MKKDNFPIAFKNGNGDRMERSKKHVSIDGTPRYICNPKSPDNTYDIEYCMERWTPIYRKTKTRANN